MEGAGGEEGCEPARGRDPDAARTRLPGEGQYRRREEDLYRHRRPPPRFAVRGGSAEGAGFSQELVGQFLQFSEQLQRLTRSCVVHVDPAEAGRNFILDGRTVGEQRELWRWRIARRS